ncbi:DUF1572 domain-containing protein [Oceanobacillus luteolus]|uniref:DUF1572 family protein n=1 Tax=Oceanobacillus luteolus TaxID=1274358 RepID=A0ABW4HQG6_9BACI|nr:DUF1572 family protein [Oceanobacillus luteolus]MCM3740259.1 DUF1572 domain-containing protein [Oceanobacillus luteolus]
MDVANEYLKVIRKQFLAIKTQGDKTLEQLSDEEFFWRPNENSNNICIIIKHMNGNMKSRWTDFLTTDGEKSDRNRDDEFVDDFQSKRDVLLLWEEGWEILFTTINQLRSDDVLKELTIRGEKHTVIEAIERQIAHYASHVGQIIYIVKYIKNENWKTISIPKRK